MTDFNRKTSGKGHSDDHHRVAFPNDNFANWSRDDVVTHETLNELMTDCYPVTINKLDIKTVALIQDPTTGVYGRNYLEAKTMLSSQSWTPPIGPVGVPTTDEEMRPYVLRLRLAILNTSGNFDIETRTYKSHWVPVRFEPYEVDRVAWEILDRTITLHKDGYGASNFDQQLHKKVDINLCFHDRITMLVILFARWKSVCDSVMKGEKILAYVAGPESYFWTCFKNVDCNIQKKAQYERGKRALKEAEERKAVSPQPTQDRVALLQPPTSNPLPQNNEH